MNNKPTKEEYITELWGECTPYEYKPRADEKEYVPGDMDWIIKGIGGIENINNMKKINEVLDKSDLINNKLIRKKSAQESLDEWKKGFMDGFEEAYKRLAEKK